MRRRFILNLRAAAQPRSFFGRTAGSREHRRRIGHADKGAALQMHDFYGSKQHSTPRNKEDRK